MTYLVFRDNTFIGHTSDKKIIKRFLKERKREYRIEEIEPQLLTDEFKRSSDFYTKQLVVYDHYDKVLCEQDLAEAFSIGHDRLHEIVTYMKKVRAEVKYVKLKDDEKKIVQSFFEMIEDIEEDLAGNESCVFLEDYFDTEDIINLLISTK